MIASRSDGYSRYNHTNSKRSMFHSLKRAGDLRRRTTSCWRRMRFSASSRARRMSHDRIASSSRVINATIGRFITIRPPARHPGQGFREAQLLESIVLRHQIAVLKRSGTRRPCFRRIDRLFWILLSRWWSDWRDSLMIVQPKTVLRWRRLGWYSSTSSSPPMLRASRSWSWPARPSSSAPRSSSTWPAFGSASSWRY
jgi:hypothetical protein